MTESNPPSYHCLKTATAQKLGRNGGGITYQVLADSDHQQLFLNIVANDSGGYFSREIVAFDAVEACLPADPSESMAAKRFSAAFVGKSANNPGFMAALLRAEGLLAGVEETSHLHLRAGDWAAWKLAMLALPGEPYVPAAKQTPAVEVAGEMPRQEMPGDEASEAHPGRRKGKRVRAIKPVEGVDHAHPA